MKLNRKHRDDVVIESILQKNRVAIPEQSESEIELERQRLILRLVLDSAMTVDDSDSDPYSDRWF